MVCILVGVSGPGVRRNSESTAFLLSQVGALSAQLFAERVAPLGISPRAYGVLSLVADSEPLTQQQLADTLGIHRNAMVALIDGMESAGWVRRQRSVADRRAYEIVLRRSGATLVRRVQLLLPGLDEVLTKGLDPSDRTALHGLLSRMVGSLELDRDVHPSMRSASQDQS